MNQIGFKPQSNTKQPESTGQTTVKKPIVGNYPTKTVTTKVV